MDGAPGTSDYPSPSLSFNGQDDRNYSSRSNQPQDAYDAFDGFNAQDMLPPERTVSNAMAQNAQPESVAMNRSMTPHMGHSAMHNSFQPNSMRPLGSLAPVVPSVAAESRNEYWDSQSMSDPQWAIPGFHRNSVPAPNPPASTNNSRPASSHMHRPMARPMARRMSNASSHQQMNALPTPRISESYPSPVLQRITASQAHPRSSNHVENTNPEAVKTRNNLDTCSHCRTCRTPNAIDDQRPGQSSPKTPTSTPSRDSSQASSPDHHEILANCSKVLADLARQSDYRDENESEQRPRSNKRNKSSLEGYFVDSSGSSQEDDHEFGHRRHKIVEKVVILCMKNGRKPKGK